MATAPKQHPVQHESKYQEWQDTINLARSDARWNAYDCDIIATVGEFNRHLSTTTEGFVPLDWKTVKAMLWTETGGPDTLSWTNQPMQIGANSADPGLQALFSGKEGGELVIPPSMAGTLTLASATATPQMNIRAGVAYLLMRFAEYGFRTVMDSDKTIYQVTVRPGDSLEKIAKANGTTVDVLQKLNKDAAILHPKQVLHYQKAAVGKYITRWKPFTLAAIASRYNIGDSRYAEKLAYCLSVMDGMKGAPACH